MSKNEFIKLGAVIGTAITGILCISKLPAIFTALFNPTNENIAEVIENEVVPCWLGPLQWITDNLSFNPYVFIFAFFCFIGFLKWTGLIK